MGRVSGRTPGGPTADNRTPGTGGQTITCTGKAVTRTSDGQTRTSPGGSASTALPDQGIDIKTGEATEGAACAAPACEWINGTLTGLDRNATYAVRGWANGHEFTALVDLTTDADGTAIRADDTCDRIRYDVPDTGGYLFVTMPSGREPRSNTLHREAG